MNIYEITKFIITIFLTMNFVIMKFRWSSPLVFSAGFCLVN